MVDGFGPEVFAWFEGLERENTREYFKRTRDVYETHVRRALTALLEALEGEFGPGVKVFRQQRDLRFSSDKTPYKTRTYGIVGERGYAEVSASGLYAGSGRPPMGSGELARYRAAVADDTTGPALEAALPAGLELDGQALKTVPRGFARDHPRAGLLRHKALIAGGRIAPGPDGIDAATALAHCRDTWRACGPMNDWLDAHVGPADRAQAR